MQGRKLLENLMQPNPIPIRTPFIKGVAGLKDSYSKEEKKQYVVASLFIKREGRSPLKSTQNHGRS